MVPYGEDHSGCKGEGQCLVNSSLEILYAVLCAVERRFPTVRDSGSHASFLLLSQTDTHFF